MATHMQMAKLDLVDGPGENTQLAAVLEEPYKITPAYAKIPDRERMRSASKLNTPAFAVQTLKRSVAPARLNSSLYPPVWAMRSAE